MAFCWKEPYQHPKGWDPEGGLWQTQLPREARRKVRAKWWTDRRSAPCERMTPSWRYKVTPCNIQMYARSAWEDFLAAPKLFFSFGRRSVQQPTLHCIRLIWDILGSFHCLERWSHQIRGLLHNGQRKNRPRTECFIMMPSNPTEKSDPVWPFNPNSRMFPTTILLSWLFHPFNNIGGQLGYKDDHGIQLETHL